MLSFCRELITDNMIKENPSVSAKQMSETLSVTMSETSRVVKRDLAVMQKVGILRHEGKGNVGVCCLLAKLAFR